MTKLMKRMLFLLSLPLIAAGSFSPLLAQTTSATSGAWDAGNIISDQIFTNTSSMSYDSILSFLKSKVPSCDTNGQQISEYGGSDLNGDGKVQRWEWGKARYNQTTFPCLRDYVASDGRNAAQIIYDISRKYNINPQVFIVLLQKEQGLITDTWPLNIQYRSATGYGCPDTAPCDSEYYGLVNQLDWSGKMFRSILNNSPSWYTPYLLGNNYVQYNPLASCGGSTISIANRSTQALYNYTPYQPNAAAIAAPMGSTVSCGAYGNINFFRYFQSWFGSTRGDHCSSSLVNTSVGVGFGNDAKNGPDHAKFYIYSGSNTGCVENHTWNSGFGSWLSNIATNSSSIDTANSQISYADLDGDGRDEPILVGLKSTGSGKVEFHVWNYSQNAWSAHYASNAPTINTDISRVAFADVDGDGKDEGILIGFGPGSSSTGKMEFHVWNQGFGTWKSHYISNANNMNPAISQISFADLDGNGKDEGVLVGLGSGSSSTGKIEFHVWNQGFGTWKSHYISNQANIDTSVTGLAFADLDGNKTDEGVLYGYGAGGSGSGKIEFHVWNQGFGTWKSHYISNQSIIK